MSDKPTPTLSLNGRRYNAISGEVVDNPAPIAQPHNIDGVLPTGHTAHQATASGQPIRHHKPGPMATPPGHHPHNTKTLMRSAVKKPRPGQRLLSSANAPLASPAVSIVIPQSIGTIDKQAARRAAAVKRSPQISRFNLEASSRSSQYSPRPVTRAEVRSIPGREPFIPAAGRQDIFERAVEHIQPPTPDIPKTSQRKRSIVHKTSILAATGLMVLASLGYMAYQNIPNIMTKIASIDAGFSAHLPSYRPAGYALQKVGYGPGLVRFSFKSTSDNRSYSLSESQSTWDSATLVSNIVNPVGNSKFSKLEVNGQTIYLYGNHQAAWVNNNVLYQVNSNGSLSTNQLIEMATAL